ncbi:MAG: DNA-binding response regulator [Chloroflexi bacterium]|nr:MAG: DNA-binding response regulator [Chloroflexota bacterium]
MSEPTHPPRRVLIVSANPLFREGLRKVYAERWGKRAVITGMPINMAETLSMLESHQPDLVIVDYDDKTINRGEFMNRFVIGENTMQVVLVSLKESGQVVVYHRRSLTSAQAEDWLSNPWNE